MYQKLSLAIFLISFIYPISQVKGSDIDWDFVEKHSNPEPKNLRETKINGIRITAQDDVEDIFLYPEDFEIEPVNPKVFSATFPIIRNCLAHYPNESLREVLKEIHVVGRLKEEGFDLGGITDFNWGRKEFVVHADEFDDLIYMDRVCHHEINHRFFDEFEDLFPTDEWKMCNSDDFKYGDGGLDFIKSGYSRAADLENGFFSGYAKSAIEEDIADTSEELFVDSINFKDAYHSHQRIKCKADILMKFYLKIDSRFFFVLGSLLS